MKLPEIAGLDTSQFLGMLEKLRDWLNSLGGAVGHSGEGSPLQFNWPDISLPQFGDLQLPDLSSFLRLGDWLKQHWSGWNAFFFTADLRLAKLIRLSASRRTPLFNGALECRLFAYKMVAGGNRKA